MLKESNISYTDFIELMKHNILPRAEQIEQQNRIMCKMLLGLLGIIVTGFILWDIYK